MQVKVMQVKANQYVLPILAFVQVRRTRESISNQSETSDGQPLSRSHGRSSLHA